MAEPDFCLFPSGLLFTDWDLKSWWHLPERLGCDSFGILLRWIFLIAGIGWI